MLADSTKKSAILIVEGKEQNLAFINDTLRAADYTNIFLAQNGKTALEILDKNNIDLILLDLTLPDMNGIDVCKAIRSNNKSKNIPIIVQTEISNLPDKQSAFKHGVSDFLSKPVDVSELLARINVQLQQMLLIHKLENAYSQMETEMEEALSVMESILPKQEFLARIAQKYSMTIDTLFKPSSKLGGDFYDIMEFDDNKLGLCLWDFSGHGMAAAINTFRLYSIINNGEHCMVRAPGTFLSSVNTILFKMLERQYFATMFYGVLDPVQLTLDFSCASCPPPLLLSFSKKQYQLLNSKEFPLGIIGNHEYKAHTIDLNQWDAMLLYSDALIETSNENNTFLTIEELAQALVDDQAASKDAKFLKKLILDKFSKDRLQNLKDDLTFKLITFKHTAEL